MIDQASHRTIITDEGYGAWADCSCGWSSQWYEHRTGAQLARQGHYAWATLPIDLDRGKRGRRWPDAREQLIDRCTCGDWRWNHQCHNRLCWTNLTHHATEEAA